MEWQQQKDRQTAEEASRKQEKEAQDRLQHQQMQEELERQRKQEEPAMKRSEIFIRKETFLIFIRFISEPKRQEKPMTPKRNDDENDENANHRNDYDQQQQSEPAYRSSSPPIPALKNKGKKPKSNVNNVRKQSFDNVSQQQSPPPLPPFDNNDDFAQFPPVDDAESQGRQTYRKPPTPRQPGLLCAFNKLYVVAYACFCRCIIRAKKTAT